MIPIFFLKIQKPMFFLLKINQIAKITVHLLSTAQDLSFDMLQDIFKKLHIYHKPQKICT